MLKTRDVNVPLATATEDGTVYEMHRPLFELNHCVRPSTPTYATGIPCWLMCKNNEPTMFCRVDSSATAAITPAATTDETKP